MHFLPVSLEKNIICGSDNVVDHEKLSSAIKQSGFQYKVNSLSQGLQTKLGKSIFDDAIDLSGGETQKFALARAIYKNGNILVLDEPTAALDPIAESEMYHQYNEMTKNKTSIFISHRLASTRFCDMIYLLEDSNIAEMGSHDTLMKTDGKYKEMFDIQSQYYKSNNNEEVAL